MICPIVGLTQYASIVVPWKARFLKWGLGNVSVSATAWPPLLFLMFILFKEQACPPKATTFLPFGTTRNGYRRTGLFSRFHDSHPSS